MGNQWIRGKFALTRFAKAKFCAAVALAAAALGATALGVSNCSSALMDANSNIPAMPPDIIIPPESQIIGNAVDAAPLTVEAQSLDGGVLSFQWGLLGEDGTETIISGAESDAHTSTVMPLISDGESYFYHYYVDVTNTKMPLRPAVARSEAIVAVVNSAGDLVGTNITVAVSGGELKGTAVLTGVDGDNALEPVPVAGGGGTYTVVPGKWSIQDYLPAGYTAWVNPSLPLELAEEDDAIIAINLWGPDSENATIEVVVFDNGYGDGLQLTLNGPDQSRIVRGSMVLTQLHPGDWELAEPVVGENVSWAAYSREPGALDNKNNDPLPWGERKKITVKKGEVGRFYIALSGPGKSFVDVSATGGRLNAGAYLKSPEQTKSVSGGGEYAVDPGTWTLCDYVPAGSTATVSPRVEVDGKQVPQVKVDSGKADIIFVNIEEIPEGKGKVRCHVMGADTVAVTLTQGTVAFEHKNVQGTDGDLGDNCFLVDAGDWVLTCDAGGKAVTLSGVGAGNVVTVANQGIVDVWISVFAEATEGAIYVAVVGTDAEVAAYFAQGGALYGKLDLKKMEGDTETGTYKAVNYGNQMYTVDPGTWNLTGLPETMWANTTSVEVEAGGTGYIVINPSGVPAASATGSIFVAVIGDDAAVAGYFAEGGELKDLKIQSTPPSGGAFVDVDTPNTAYPNLIPGDCNIVGVPADWAVTPGKTVTVKAGETEYVVIDPSEEPLEDGLAAIYVIGTGTGIDTYLQTAGLKLTPVSAAPEMGEPRPVTTPNQRFDVVPGSWFISIPSGEDWVAEPGMVTVAAGERKYIVIKPAEGPQAVTGIFVVTSNGDMRGGSGYLKQIGGTETPVLVDKSKGVAFYPLAAGRWWFDYTPYDINSIVKEKVLPEEATDNKTGLTLLEGETAVIYVSFDTGFMLDLTDLVPAPMTHAMPVTSFSTAQYTGTVEWTPKKFLEVSPYDGGSKSDAFDYETVYTATITLMALYGNTFAGLPANSFWHTASSYPNDAVSSLQQDTGAGVTLTITITFRITGAGDFVIPI